MHLMEPERFLTLMIKIRKSDVVDRPFGRWGLIFLQQVCEQGDKAVGHSNFPKFSQDRKIFHLFFNLLEILVRRRPKSSVGITPTR